MAVVTNSQHDLQFGSLDLIDVDTVQGAGGFHFEVMGDDADWGNPQPIEEKIVTWLQDGAIVALRGYDNRDMFLRVKVVGKDGQALALGEQALMLETGKTNLLTWTPPDGVGKPCVFGVINSHLEHVFDDVNDEMHLQRTYGLRITAEPFARSSTPVSVSQAAPPGGGPTVTSIDACTATTNWTGTPNAPTTSGGAVKETKFVDSFQLIGTLSLKRSSLAVNMTGKPYLRIDWDMDGGGDVTNTTVKVNGTTILTPVAQSGTARWYDYGTQVGVGTTLTSIEITYTNNSTRFSVPINRVLEVADISQSDSIVDPGSTNRQLARVLPVAGSARTQGNLAVEDSANALGTALVYTCPAVSGMRQPPLRAVLQPGPTPTVDGTTVSGATSPLDTQHVFYVPINGLQPGAHLLLARVKHASSGARTINYFGVSIHGSNEVGDRQSGSIGFNSVAGVWQVVTVGAMTLPPTKVGKNGIVAVSMTASAGVVLDEAWLFNVETGRLTWVECGTAAPSAGGTSNRLWLDAPTVDNPVPAVYRGVAADRSDSQHAASEMVSFGNHEFIPTSMNVFTVTTNSTASVVTLSHYPRWHTHAAA